MATSTPLPVEEVEEASDTPHITIPPTEMMKISVMLKETFIDEIESMVDCGEGSPERVAGTDNCIRKTSDELQT